MRVYTCVFEKSGDIKMENLNAPWDRAPAIAAAKEVFALGNNDRLIAMIPGNHTTKSWLVQNEKSTAPKNVVVESKQKIDLSNYIPNGF